MLQECCLLLVQKLKVVIITVTVACTQAASIFHVHVWFCWQYCKWEKQSYRVVKLQMEGTSDFVSLARSKALACKIPLVMQANNYCATAKKIW